MTPIERAEKIARDVMKKLEDFLPVEDCGNFYSQHIEEYIAAQISEAVREVEDKLRAHWFGPAETDWGEGIKAQGYAEGFRAGQLDAQYDNDTLPGQIAAYKKLAYELGFNAAQEQANKEKGLEWSRGFEVAREKAKGIAENFCPDENFGEDCHESIAQRIGEMEP